MNAPVRARPVVVDARDPSAREVVLGLPGWRRALLAAKYAGAAPLALVAEGPAAEALRRELAEDPRLRDVALIAPAARLEAPWSRALHLPGGAVVDRAAVAALAASGVQEPAPGDGLVVRDGLYLPPDRPREVKVERLLRSLANPCDGLVDTWLNRPLSRQLSRVLVGTGISPNAVTLISFLIGALGAGLIAAGGWALGVVGALLFQLSAAVDCVDGELARLTYRFSPLGAKLDLALDNVAHLLLFAAVAVHAAGALGASWALGLGAAAVFGSAASCLLVYALTFHWPELASRGRLKQVLDRFTNRDFSVAVIAVALLGWWHLLLVGVAVGTQVFWLSLAWTVRAARRAA